MKFLVPINKLSHAEKERYNQLQSYFCDQRANSYDIGVEWSIETYWPPEAEYFVDPLINNGISWWQPSIDLSEIHHQVRDMKGYQLSLNDSWTLYSWSKWLFEKDRKNIVPEEVIILHIDYHNDLMSPRLGYPINSAKKDLLTKSFFDINQPETVRSAILSGAIGVGSFMVPFLHEIKKVHLRHLCEHVSKNKEVSENALRREFELDTLLMPDELRPKVSFYQLASQNIPENAIQYKVTNDLTEWLSNLPQAPILLHIDMDYFNCRYDGDSDWQKYLPRYDPPYELMQKQMDSIFSAITQSGLRTNVEDIAVSLSPGFYPTEFWKDSIQRISELVEELRN
jgi:hypothetical protein